LNLGFKNGVKEDLYSQSATPILSCIFENLINKKDRLLNLEGLIDQAFQNQTTHLKKINLLLKFSSISP
jgi:hypothetical protein